MFSYLITLLLFLIYTVESTTNHHGIRLELVHRDTLETTPKFRRLDEETVGADKKRHSVITQKRNVRGGAKWILGSGYHLGNAQYFTEIKVGTPPKKFRVVVDTGSELTWVGCRYRQKGKRKASHRHRRRHRHKKGHAHINLNRSVFRADASKSFTTIGCSTKTCTDELAEIFSVGTCPNPSNPCSYEYSYLDGSRAQGIFGKETFTFDLTNGTEAKLEGVLMGCSNSFSGNTFQQADGVLALGNADPSFTTRSVPLFGHKFSYCLVDHLSEINVTNFLIFGSSPTIQKTGPVTTAPLDINLMPPFYAIDIVGISIGDKMLDIPPQIWDPAKGGGTILDSGSSLTFLSTEAYKAVTTELDRHIVGYERIDVTDKVPLHHCYATPDGFDESKVPQLVFHFRNGTRFEPYRKSYVIEVTIGRRCLGFISAGPNATNIIGNIMQQNFLWEFDLAASTLSFAPSTCT